MEIKNKITILLSFLMFVSFGVTSQTSYQTAKTIKGKGKKCYEKALDYYRSDETDKAMEHFNKALKIHPDLIDAHLRVGAIFYEKKKFDNAETSLKKAISLDPEYDKRIYFSLANIQRENKKYEQAASNYQKFIDRTERKSDVLDRAIKYQKQSYFAAKAIKNPVPFEPKKLNEAINKETSEYLPSISADGNSMIFTVRKGTQEDLFRSQKIENVWQERTPIDDLNTSENEGAHTLSGDGKFIVFAKKTRHYNFDLYYSEWIENKWTPVKNMDAPINTRTWESQPCLSADGKTLYFSSDRPGGFGGSDIWKSTRSAEGSWSKPTNLGPTINTKGHEESPFIHHDDQTLYFRSNEHPGMGDFDIFFAKKEKENWTNITNIGYPINTTGSEGAMIVSLDGQTAYFASDMAGKKNLDIYEFELYEDARPEKVSYLKANIFDFQTKNELTGAHVIIENVSNGKRILDFSLKTENNFISPIIIGENYAINISREGYLFHSENFKTDSLNVRVKPMILDIYLNAIPEMVEVESEPIILRNVFFETGSSELKDESVFELQKLKTLLVENPKMKIKINGHTDNVGIDSDNQILSEQRAKAVYEYLVLNGILASRLHYQGYGESKPIDDNDSEEGRQRNRRTEFVIIPD